MSWIAKLSRVVSCDPSDQLSWKYTPMFFIGWYLAWTILTASEHYPPCVSQHVDSLKHNENGYCTFGQLYSPASVVDEMTYKPTGPLHYLQWTRAFLAICFVICLAPNWMWKTDQERFDYLIHFFKGETRQLNHFQYEPRAFIMTRLAFYIRDIVRIDDPNDRIEVRDMIGKFVATKISYVVIGICQFLLLAVLVGKGNNVFWGAEVLGNISKEFPWQSLDIFPREALCLTTVRSPNGLDYTLADTCTLPMNEMNEKLFVVLWFWLCWRAFLVPFSALIIFYRMYSSRFVISLLHRFHDGNNERLMNRIKRFAKTDLNIEEQMILMFINDEDPCVAEEVTYELFIEFLRRCSRQRRERRERRQRRAQ